MPTRAVLFDFDGVIADTENVHIAAWERTFAEMGWDVPPEVCARAAEEDDRLFLAGVFDARGIEDGDVAGWVRRKQVRTIAMLAAWPRLYGGVHELVSRLEGHAALAVVSTTWRENVTTVLGSAGLDHAFSVIVSKEDVTHPKPNPEAYRLALKRLRVPASNAVAFEDSPTGLVAAKSAGVRVIAIGHRRDEGEWSEGSEYVGDLSDVSDVAHRLRLR